MRGREVRGAPYSAQWESSTHSGSPDVYRELVGFRLVHDSEQRKARGAPWTIPEPEGLGALNRPHSSGRTVGFRLAHDKEDT